MCLQLGKEFPCAGLSGIDRLLMNNKNMCGKNVGPKIM
jgi:hypothetical protein